MANQYCSNCGQSVSQGGRFCAGCGTPVQRATQGSFQEPTSQDAGMPDREQPTGVEFREAKKSLPWEPKYYEVYHEGEKAGEIAKAPFGGAWYFDGSRSSYQSRADAAYAVVHGEAPTVEAMSAPSSQTPPPTTQAPPGEGMRRAGSSMMSIGCLLTLLITIPIVLLVLLFLVL